MTDAQLTRLYGTPDLEKTGSPAAGLLAAILGYKAIEKLRGDQEDARAQGEQNDVMARELEARDMLATRRGSRGRGGVVPDATDYQSLGPEELAQLGAMMSGAAKTSSVEQINELVHDIVELEKDAGLGGLVGSAISAVGRGAGSLGRGLQKGFTPTGRFMRAGLDDATKFQSAVKPLSRAGIGQSLREFGVKARQYGGQLQRAAGPAAAAPAAVAAAQKSKPLIGWGTKAKLLGTAGVLGAGYVGYKGLQGARDYMMQPSGGHHPGYLKHNVNEYGY